MHKLEINPEKSAGVKLYLKVVSKIAIFIFLFLQPIFVYIQSYNPKDCDDKAVHYYSSAFFHSPHSKKQDLIKLTPFYLEKLTLETKKLRLARRLVFPPPIT